mgnify:CR=1 FL=1
MTRIKDILNERKISLKEFAAELGISYTALYLQINKPSYPTLEKWAAVLNIPMWQLFASPEDVAASTQQEGQGVALVCPYCGKPLHVDLFKSGE